jgi:hypothetical protein
MNNDQIFLEKIEVFTRLETSTFFKFFYFFRKISHYSSLFNDYKRSNQQKKIKNQRKSSKNDEFRFFLEDEIVRSSMS